MGTTARCLFAWPGMPLAPIASPMVVAAALLAATAAATTIGNAIGASGMPGHANKHRAVVPIVSRPPRLRVGHQGMQVLDHGIQIEGLEFFRIFEFIAHRIRQRGLLVQDFKVQLFRPPASVGCSHGVGLIEPLEPGENGH